MFITEAQLEQRLKSPRNLANRFRAGREVKTPTGRNCRHNMELVCETPGCFLPCLDSCSECGWFFCPLHFHREYALCDRCNR